MRLKDADELIEEIKSMKIWLGGKDIFQNEAKESIIQLIEDEPTAYDIDKVVEDLEEKKIHHIMLADYENKCGTIVERQGHLKAIEALNDAIEIVKQGLKGKK